MELVDAVLRRFKQFDDCLYVNEGSLRWRHYVECDFMVCSFSYTKLYDFECLTYYIMFAMFYFVVLWLSSLQ